ncbi:GNAT family N-acetyltransferase [Geomicrobium sp. JSM 1781026]|uniref:GNAT family N-acetyltransferase n=1 Tax=Geomicrobium sp. JSM 1781026 TaxID=3344580 RepID=UPI0035BF3EB5
MIRRLTQADHEECFALLKTKAAENLFIIGDIEAFGYEQDFQRLWGEWDERGELIAVLLKYRQNYIPFAVAPFDALAFSEIMLKDSEFHMMSGLKETTEKIEPYLGAYKRKRETYYAKCTTVKNDFRDVSVVERATETDAEPIVNLLNSIPEFDQSVDVTASDKRKGMEDGVSRSVYVQVGGRIVSTASTAAENTVSAMIIAVGTHADYKRKGYASQCMQALCQELISEGKELCLFYDNPEAGNIYKRIGFEDIGFWMMYTYE